MHVINAAQKSQASLFHNTRLSSKNNIITDNGPSSGKEAQYIRYRPT